MENDAGAATPISPLVEAGSDASSTPLAEAGTDASSAPIAEAGSDAPIDAHGTDTETSDADDPDADSTSPTVDAGQTPPVDSGSSDAHAGGADQPDAEPSCVPGSPCIVDDPCWTGHIDCSSGAPLCLSDEPALARTPCGTDGECTGDGTCIARVPSCTEDATPGCGFVTVVGGTFTMGEPSPDLDAGVTTQPNVTVSTFVIDAYEATVARFRKFWDAGHPLSSGVTYPNGVEVGQTAAFSDPDSAEDNLKYNWTWQPSDREDHPINRISWNMAFAFCAWDGGRVPTEAEWEYAARGRHVGDLQSGRLYPWGDVAPTCEIARFRECPYTAPATVPASAHPPSGGIYGLAGNVHEWTADRYEPYGSSCWDAAPKLNPLCLSTATVRTVRGGAFASEISALRSTWRVGTANRSGTFGIRCVRDAISGAL